MVKSWGDISLMQYIELAEVSKDDSFDNEDDRTFAILAILLDKSIEEIENMDFDKFNKILPNLNFVYQPITDNYKSNIKIDGFEFEAIPFNSLEFGAFIDLEHLFSEGDSYLYNLPKIFTILYRQKIKEATALNKAIYEPYSDWLDIRSVLFEKVAVSEVYGLINEYIKFRTRIFSNYQGLFQEKDEFDEEEEKEMLREMTAKEREEYQKEKNVSKWSWMLLLFRLADSKPMNMLKAADMKILEAFNILSMQHELKMA